MSLDQLVIALCLIAIVGVGVFGLCCLAINSSNITREEENEDVD